MSDFEPGDKVRCISLGPVIKSWDDTRLEEIYQFIEDIKELIES